MQITDDTLIIVKSPIPDFDRIRWFRYQHVIKSKLLEPIKYSLITEVKRDLVWPVRNMTYLREDVRGSHNPAVKDIIYYGDTYRIWKRKRR